MSVIEIRNSERSRAFLLQSLLCHRVSGLREDAFLQALGVAYEMANQAQPLLPIGMIADITHLSLLPDASQSIAHASQILPATTAQLYEDNFLGKLYADTSFERAAAALARYQGREQLQALAYLLHHMQSRGDLPAVLLNPSIIRSLQRLGGTKLLEAAQESLVEQGRLPEIVDLYDDSIQAVRRVGDLLGTEDIFELESRTALGSFGQRVALRQIMRLAGEYERLLPHQPMTPESQRRQFVPTQLQDEDAYPVGGFTSISTRGSIESLLHSQLAFMETDDAERPDLFDIKFLRDELLYYARDENQFFRQRRTYLFVLHSNLEFACVKDPGQRYQRVIYALAMLICLTRKLTGWLSDESLKFEIVFPNSLATKLSMEQDLLDLIFQQQQADGLVGIHHIEEKQLQPFVTQAANHALCHVISLSSQAWKLRTDQCLLSQLVVQAQPELYIEETSFDAKQNNLAVESKWEVILLQLAQRLML